MADGVMTAADAPIGVFDSGIGGLTVLRSLARLLPHERFIYLGDTARLPYGTKSAQTVARYAVQAAEALARHGVKAIVIACNTASSVGLDAIHERLGDLPVIGVIEPGARAAVAATSTGRIAVIATEATVRGGAYERAILRQRPGAIVTQLPTQLLVALAEEGLVEGEVAESVVRHYLGPLFDPACAVRAARSVQPVQSVQGPRETPPDTLVLGCTHFPLLVDAIRGVVGPSARIVDSAETTAVAVRERLQAAGIAREQGAPSFQFMATDGPERFARVGGRFLRRAIEPGQVELVDL